MSYLVFSVENADRLTLLVPSSISSAQPTFKQIALSYIKAPTQAKRTISGGFGPEEPCARDAAELVRAAFIGKNVTFEEDYFIEEVKRSAGRLQLLSGEDASVMLLEAGLAIVPEHLPMRINKPLLDRYRSLMMAAQAARKGVFHPRASSRVRQMRNLSPTELKELVQKYTDKEVFARVERALSAVVFLISSREFGDTHIPVHLSGIEDLSRHDEELAAKARFYTERFLLNRNVNLRIDGTDDTGNILVSILSRKGSFQEELLSKGFTRVDRRASLKASQNAELAKVEAEAKSKRRGVWQNFVDDSNIDQRAAVEASGKESSSAAEPQKKPVQVGIPAITSDGAKGPSYTGPLNFTGRLVQVVHGDTVVVRDEHTKQYIRISLSGIRASKNITRDQDGNAPECTVTYRDYSWEAKEFLRTRFIGARVAVSIEYARVIPESKEVRPGGAVVNLDTGINVAAALLEEGYATFFLRRGDVCLDSNSLQVAEERAKEKKKGLHSGKPCATVTIMELGRLGEAKGRYYLGFLQRGGQGGRPPLLRGVVDLVLGSTSLRVYIPKQNFQIPLKLAGVIAPNAAQRPNQRDDPFAAEAKDFVTCLVQQREVNIQVHTSDRGGNFISSVILEDGRNLSVALVEEGLATVGNADRLPFAEQLTAAEAAARSVKKNIWSEEGAIPQRAAKIEAERSNLNSAQLVRVPDDGSDSRYYVISEVGKNGLSVYLQVCGPDVDEQKARIQTLLDRAVSSTMYTPKKKGELVIAEYKPDKMWCRARVSQIMKDKGTVQVEFIDFGNTDAVSLKRIRALPELVEYDIVRKTPAFAKVAYLAFVKKELPSMITVSDGEDVVFDYTDAEVTARPMYKDGSGATYYMITAEGNSVSLGETLLREGYAILDSRAASLFPSEYKRHEAAQETARKQHRVLWQYGDINDDEEDDLR